MPPFTTAFNVPVRKWWIEFETEKSCSISRRTTQKRRSNDPEIFGKSEFVNFKIYAPIDPNEEQNGRHVICWTAAEGQEVPPIISFSKKYCSSNLLYEIDLIIRGIRLMNHNWNWNNNKIASSLNLMIFHNCRWISWQHAVIYHFPVHLIIDSTYAICCWQPSSPLNSSDAIRSEINTAIESSMEFIGNLYD